MKVGAALVLSDDSDADIMSVLRSRTTEQNVGAAMRAMRCATDAPDATLTTSPAQIASRVGSEKQELMMEDGAAEPRCMRETAV